MEPDRTDGNVTHVAAWPQATPTEGWWPRALPDGTSLWAQAARISLAEASERVRQATKGRVLDARDEGSHHRIKVLTPQGEVRVVIVDARTGALR